MIHPGSPPPMGAVLPGRDEDTTVRLVEHYSGRLLALVRRYLGTCLRRKVDPEDVLQSVLRSFFRRQADVHWDLADEDCLWHLLVRITARKCGRCLDHFHAARRDVRREVTTVPALACTEPDSEPTPPEAAMLAETAELVMNRLATEAKRRIFELSLHGYSIPEISDRVGYYERGVERVRAEIKRILQGLMADDPSRSLPSELA